MAVGDPIKLISDNNYELFPAAHMNIDTGILTGGVVTINSGDDTLVDIAAGTGVVIDWTDPANPLKTMVSWNAFIGESVPNLATGVFTSFAISAAGALIKVSLLIPTPNERRTRIYLQSATHTSGTKIDSITGSSVPAYDKIEAILDYVRNTGTVNSGNNYSAFAADLQLDKAAGTTTLPFINRSADPMSPAVQTNAANSPLANFTVAYQNGSGGTTFDAATLVDPDQYDDGSGTLATVGNNKWTIKRLYFFGQNGATTVAYGQNQYNSLSDAESALPTEPFVVSALLESGSLTSYLIIIKGGTDLSDIADAKFITV